MIKLWIMIMLVMVIMIMIIMLILMIILIWSGVALNSHLRTAHHRSVMGPVAITAVPSMGITIIIVLIIIVIIITIVFIVVVVIIITILIIFSPSECPVHHHQNQNLISFQVLRPWPRPLCMRWVGMIDDEDQNQNNVMRTLKVLTL